MKHIIVEFLFARLHEPEKPAGWTGFRQIRQTGRGQAIPPPGYGEPIDKIAAQIVLRTPEFTRPAKMKPHRFHTGSPAIAVIAAVKTTQAAVKLGHSHPATTPFDNFAIDQGKHNYRTPVQSRLLGFQRRFNQFQFPLHPILSQLFYPVWNVAGQPSRRYPNPLEIHLSRKIVLACGSFYDMLSRACNLGIPIRPVGYNFNSIFISI